MELVNGKKLAELLHVTGPTIWTWQKHGLPIEQRGGRGKQNLYKVADVLAWLKRTGYGGGLRVDRAGGVPVEMLEQHVSGKSTGLAAGDDIGLSESRAKKERFQAALAELEYLEKVGQLVSAADVEREVGEIYREVKSAVMRIVPRTSAQLVKEMDQAHIERILTDALNRTFNELSELLAAAGGEGPPPDDSLHAIGRRENPQAVSGDKG